MWQKCWRIGAIVRVMVMAVVATAEGRTAGAGVYEWQPNHGRVNARSREAAATAASVVGLGSLLSTWERGNATVEPTVVALA